MSELDHICMQRNRVRTLSYAVGLILTLVGLGLTSGVIITGCATQQASKAMETAIRNRQDIAVSKAEFDEIRRQLTRIENKLESTKNGGTP